MASAGILPPRRRNAALSLAALLLLLGLILLILFGGKAPVAQADSPTLLLTTGQTNPGGEVDITGTGWAPATHYNLYVYGQARCSPNPTCPPPTGQKTINSSPIPITSDGRLQEFDFTFIKTAGFTTYVFTVVADYPTDTPFSASVLVQVVPLGTPTAVGTVSSAPSPTSTTVPPTAAPASPTALGQTPGNGNGNQTTPTSPGFFSSTTNVLIVIVLLLLILMGAILVLLLRTLPAKRRAIRAAYYGDGGDQGYGTPPPGASGPRRQTSGGYRRGSQTEQPWQGGVASWDENRRPSRPSAGNRPNTPPAGRTTPRPPPRKPTGREW